MKKYWNIFIRFRKMNLMIMFEYRTEFIFWAFVSGMWTIFHFFFVHLLVTSSGQIGGWNQAEIYLLMSLYTIYDAFTWSFFYYNFKRFTNNIFTGQLDRFLLKPIDSQFLLTIEHNSYNNLTRFFIGIGMLIYSIAQLDQHPNLFEYLLFFVLLILGFFLLYSLWFFIATFAFWFEKLDNINDVIPSLRRVSQFPKSVYTGIFSIIFSVFFPITLMTSIPAEALINKLTPHWLLFYIFATLFFFYVSRQFFHFSLRKYSGAGS